MTSITASMLSTGKYSDLLIKCRGKDFKVHRAVFCLQSKPLAAAIDGNFKEAVTREIDLDGNEPDVVQCMLQFLYTSDYQDGSVAKLAQATTKALTAFKTRQRITVKRQKLGKSLFPASDLDESVAFSAAVAPSTHTHEELTALLINLKVYIVGDQLDIQSLKLLAKEKYEAVVVRYWNSDLFVASLDLSTKKRQRMTVF